MCPEIVRVEHEGKDDHGHVADDHAVLPLHKGVGCVCPILPTFRTGRVLRVVIGDDGGGEQGEDASRGRCCCCCQGRGGEAQSGPPHVQVSLRHLRGSWEQENPEAQGSEGSARASRVLGELRGGPAPLPVQDPPCASHCFSVNSISFVLMVLVMGRHRRPARARKVHVCGMGRGFSVGSPEAHGEVLGGSEFFPSEKSQLLQKQEKVKRTLTGGRGGEPRRPRGASWT